MDETTGSVLQAFLQGLESLLTPVGGTVAFGNVRQQVSHWEGQNPVTNVAVIYESPGGSTNQINIVYDHASDRFRLLNEDTGQEDHLEESSDVLERVNRIIRSIPEIRMKRLKWDIDRWVLDGKPLSQILSTLNKLLQFDSGLRGGAITQDELKEATRYVAQRVKERG